MLCSMLDFYYCILFIIFWRTKTFYYVKDNLHHSIFTEPGKYSLSTSVPLRKHRTNCDKFVWLSEIQSFSAICNAVAISEFSLSRLPIINFMAASAFRRGHMVAQLVEALFLIPDVVIGIFHWHNPSGRTMALGSTQPLTEMSTRNISWGKGGRCVGLTLPPSCADCLEIW